jgi:nitroreductase
VENICAAAAAIENLLLTVQAIGLAGMWRTGAAVSEPRVKELLGLQPEQPLIALLYIGYPVSEAEKGSTQKARDVIERPSFIDRTIWME